MNKIFSMIAIAALIVVSVGCDKIDNPLKPFTPQAGTKTVLVKDFTGVRCNNCPGAAEIVHQLQHQLGEDRVIVMSVHAGSLANPGTVFPDFRTDEGTIWYNNNMSNPLFSVDHVALTEGNTFYVNQIDAPVSEALGEEQTFDIHIVSVYDEATRILNVDNQILPLRDGQGQYYVTACLVEDSITGWQMVPTSAEHPEGVDTAYVFRNVFRCTLNGADGALVVDGNFYPDDAFVTANEIELDPTYNADQCYVLTYIYDKLDGKILQTALNKIK